MKVIDLLNKIANGEEIPKTIRYCDDTWYWNTEEKDYIAEYRRLFSYYLDEELVNSLNDEIEVIEEDKINKPKIKPIGNQDSVEEKIITVHDNTFILLDKIDEIIDKLNKE